MPSPSQKHDSSQLSERSVLRDDELDVIFFPWFSDTSYQSDLEEALKQDAQNQYREITIRRAKSIAACRKILFDDLLGRTSENRIFHLHWVHDMFIASSITERVIRVIGTFVFLFAFRLAGRPVVWTAHNLTTHDNAGHPLIRRFVRHIVARFLAARTFVHCNQAADMLIRNYRLPDRCRSKIVVAPHGTWPQRIAANPSDRIAATESGSGMTYLAFGKIRPYKRPDTLARTFCDYADVDSQLIIAGGTGDGPANEQLAQQLRRIDRNDPYNRIDLRLRYVPNEELEALFAECDVMLAAYRDILTSGVTAIAAAHGVPVVGPRIGCLPSQVSSANQALLYRSGGNDYIDQFLGKAIEDIESGSRDRLVGIGMANREHALERDWIMVAGRVHSTYQAVVKE